MARKVHELTREELYKRVWQTPMRKLSKEFGLSDRGLAKICTRMNIPVPHRGYWAKKQASKKVKQTPLPKAPSKSQETISIHPTPTPEEPPQLPDKVQASVEKLTDNEISIPKRITRYHPVIAQWLRTHREETAKAREDRWGTGYYFRPAPFTQSDKRRHKILHVLFKALEKEGFKIEDGEKNLLLAKKSSEEITFQLREKHRQVRRPLDEDEKRWKSPGSKDWKLELEPTGYFVFEIKTYLPSGLKSEWLEKEKHPIEELLPKILATFVSAIPGLVSRTEQRHKAEEVRRQEASRRHEAEREQELQDNRWKHLSDLARQAEEVSQVKQLLSALKQQNIAAETPAGANQLSDWLEWADKQVSLRDPRNQPANEIFDEVSRVTAWTFPDRRFT